MSFQWSLGDRSIGDGFLRIAREQIEKAIAIVEDGAEPSARRVHEARRRAKKLRALLRLVRPDFSHYAQENGFLRDAARELSAARDVKVARDTLAALMQWAGRDAPPEHPVDAGEQEEAGLRRFGDRMRDMLERTARWKIGKVDIETLADGLADTYRRGQEAMHLVVRHPSDLGFHEWRKHAKYHWNQIGLIESCAEDILPSAHKAVGELADVLGQHHDLAVLREMLGRDAGKFDGLDTGFVDDAAKRRQAELEEKISALGRQVYAETPKALQARYLSYLGGWMAREAAE